MRHIIFDQQYNVDSGSHQSFCEGQSRGEYALTMFPSTMAFYSPEHLESVFSRHLGDNMRMYIYIHIIDR